MNKKYSGFIKDIALNITSVALLTGIIQLIIFPLISKSVNAEHFGIIIALYGINNVIVNFLGNSLNNIRLINDSTTREKGNFTVLLMLAILISSVIAAILFFLYGKNLSNIELIITIIFTAISTLRVYLVVFFRINLNYVNILLTNLVVSLGYLIGLMVYTWIPIWSFIFLIGELFGITYLFIKTPILKEPPKKDEKYDSLAYEYVHLSSSNGIANVLNYLDRFFINPVLGPNNLSIYYSVSVVSKFIGMIVIPFNNVLLSYMNQMSPERAKKNFINTNIACLILLIPLYLIINIISPILIEFLYPKFSSVGSDYIWIINLATIFMLLSSIVNPYIIKFANIKYQFRVQLIYGIVYITLAIVLSLNYGLMGFCFASLISFFVKWLLILHIGIMKIGGAVSWS